MKAKKPYHKRRKIIGRGVGSGHGKTSTKGHKGQRARAGFQQRPGFEGGQNPLYRRVPKRGFNQSDRRTFAIVNLDQIAALKDKEVTPESLLNLGVIRKREDGLKVLGRGALTRAVTIKAHRFSESAKAAIEKAGGKAIILELIKQNATS